MRSVNGKRTQWLDKALEDQPSDRRARVLEIILKYGIDPEDEFFIIFVALGQLQALIEESPQSWQTLFADFESALKTWSNENLAILAATAENSKEHSEGLRRLSTILSIYGRILEQQKNDIANLNQNYKSSNNQQNNYYRTWDKTLNDISSKIEKLLQSHRQNRQQKREISNAKMIGAIAFFLLFGFSVLGFSQWRQYQLIQQVNRRSEWMWANQLRKECINGERDKNSKECKSLSD